MGVRVSHNECSGNLAPEDTSSSGHRFSQISDEAVYGFLEVSAFRKCLCSRNPEMTIYKSTQSYYTGIIKLFENNKPGEGSCVHSFLDNYLLQQIYIDSIIFIFHPIKMYLKSIT